MQNEILEIQAHMVQRGIVAEIKRSLFYAIIADSTTDMAGTEQLAVCVCIVKPESLSVEEFFIGAYSPQDSTAATLATCIKDVLHRLTLTLQDLCGHCFDSATNTSGRMHGAQKILRNEQPKSSYIHCNNHALDLALQEVCQKPDAMCEVLTIVKDASMPS